MAATRQGASFDPATDLARLLAPSVAANGQNARAPFAGGANIVGTTKMADQARLPLQGPPADQTVPPMFDGARLLGRERLAPAEAFPVRRNAAGVVPDGARTALPSILPSVYSLDNAENDGLFVPVGVKENKAQGGAAHAAEAEPTRKENPEMRMAQQIRIYAEGAPDYMVADILCKPNALPTSPSPKSSPATAG